MNRGPGHGGLSYAPLTVGGVALLWMELGWRCSPSSGSFLRLGARVIVVRLGRPLSLLVYWLARFVVVRSPNNHVITLGGGCHPTVASPVVAEWLS
jgi:hypothetical protein